ncbi:hypothetical protein D7I44_07845 [Gryllotalpicola protaetiae]|uniref:Flavodoxin-like domain-containing protein n=2 Tax=Gryllotalpicola protaetiae TaxID=2419771 RepID=A0A387BR51_9MICO|nr:hypothetical protein D7I44_07845 [Gryllotalpicola protaetiae]
MRTGLVLTGGVLASAALAACTPRTGTTVNESGRPSPAAHPTPSAAPAQRVLIAYFSRAGENYRYGGRVDLKVGNTQVAAEMIADRITADVYRIQAANPYPHDYEQTVARNVQEEQDDVRPAIRGQLPSLDDYDTILLGSPIWNVQVPMIMRTFAEALNWSGKDVYPFVTYAVSGMGNAQTDYTDLCNGATVHDGLALQGETIHDAGQRVQSWLQRTGLA